MKNIKGKVKFYNKNLVKKTIGTGAFILVAGVSSSKPFTIICSISAGLLIANIINSVKKSHENNTNSSIRKAVIQKLKDKKAEIINQYNELNAKANQEMAKENITCEKSSDTREKQAVKKIDKPVQKLSPLEEYIMLEKAKQSSK